MSQSSAPRDPVLSTLTADGPCSWAEGLSGSREFFISPRVNDWVIVTGLGLPHPGVRD